MAHAFGQYSQSFLSFSFEHLKNDRNSCVKTSNKKRELEREVQIWLSTYQFQKVIVTRHTQFNVVKLVSGAVRPSDKHFGWSVTTDSHPCHFTLSCKLPQWRATGDV